MADPIKYDCVIWGGYARGNTGDELCLAAALARARREFGPAVAVLSVNPEYTAWLFPEATVVPFVLPNPVRPKRWRNFFKRGGGLLPAAQRGQSPAPPGRAPDWEWRQCLHSARRLYLAGGGYLNDLWPPEAILAPLELAVQMKLPVSTAPLGLGPFKSAVWAKRVAGLLKQTELKVRDRVSLEFCRTHGLQAVLEPDDAFALIASWPSAPPPTPAGPRRPKIGICIFPQYGQPAGTDLTDWWMHCLRGLQREHPGHELEGFCFHTSPAAEFQEMARLFPRVGLPPGQVLAPVLDFRQATAGLRKYDFIITTRFHAVVAANVFKIPNIAIAAGDYYLAKMNAAVVGHEHLSTVVNPIGTSPDTLLELCKRELARHAAGAC